MDINWITKQAKKVLIETGQHLPQIIAETSIDGEKKLAIVAIPFRTSEEKEKALEGLRTLIKEMNVDRYWAIFEAWMSKVEKGEKPFRRASRDIDRTEILSVSEFNKDMTQKCIIVPFKRENDKIIFEEEIADNNYHSSIWNVYLEKEGIDEGASKLIDEINGAYFKKLAKNLTEKYLDKFNNLTTKEEKNALLKQMLQEIQDEKQKQDRSMLEDVEENEDEV